MKEQISTTRLEGGRTTYLEGEPWFNINYKVRPLGESYGMEHLPQGEIIPHPVGRKMTIEDFIEVQMRLSKSPSFLEVECEKLESPQNDPDSVKSINDFEAVYGGPLTRARPDVTIDAGFGEMHHRTYVCKDKPGVITLRTSTGNKYANEISFYSFTEVGF